MTATDSRNMRARFSGSPSDLLPHDPEIGDTISFTVNARCAKHVEDETADGERRWTAGFVVTSIVKVDGEAPVSPDGPGDDPLPGFGDDPDADGEFG